jgi:hypothetical protein
MATFEERIYSLGVDALAERELQVAEVRGRASVLLAAGAVVPSLRAKSVFHGDHPEGLLEIAPAAIGAHRCRRGPGIRCAPAASL